MAERDGNKAKRGGKRKRGKTGDVAEEKQVEKIRLVRDKSGLCRVRKSSQSLSLLTPTILSASPHTRQALSPKEKEDATFPSSQRDDVEVVGSPLPNHSSPDSSCGEPKGVTPVSPLHNAPSREGSDKSPNDLEMSYEQCPVAEHLHIGSGKRTRANIQYNTHTGGESEGEGSAGSWCQGRMLSTAPHTGDYASSSRSEVRLQVQDRNCIGT